MRIVCPNCDAAYEVPQTMLAPDRSVRCARCGQDWAPAAALPLAPPALAPPSPASASPPVAPATVPPPPPPASRVARVIPVAGDPVLDLRRIRSLPVVPLPPVPGEAPPPPADPAPAPPVAEAAALPPAPRVRVPVLAGWILSALVLLGSAWAAYVWRADIVRAWPPSARVYTALGVAER